MDNVLFCSSVLMFATTAILAYWQIVRAQIEKCDQPDHVLQGPSADLTQTVFADLAA